MLRKNYARLHQKQLKKMLNTAAKLNKQYDYLFDLGFPKKGYINSGKPIECILAGINNNLLELRTDLTGLCYGKWKKGEIRR